MRRLVVVPLLLLALGAAPASASHGAKDFVSTGTILVPSGLVGLGAFIWDFCGSQTDLEGVDGEWIELPEEAGGHAFSLTGDEPNDFDIVFLNANCDTITGQDNRSGDESGTVPADSLWAYVWMPVGANGTYTLTISAAAN